MAVTNNTDRDSYKRGTKHIFFQRKSYISYLHAFPAFNSLGYIIKTDLHGLKRDGEISL